MNYNEFLHYLYTFFVKKTVENKYKVIKNENKTYDTFFIMVKNLNEKPISSLFNKSIQILIIFIYKWHLILSLHGWRRKTDYFLRGFFFTIKNIGMCYYFTMVKFAVSQYTVVIIIYNMYIVIVIKFKKIDEFWLFYMTNFFYKVHLNVSSN